MAAARLPVFVALHRRQGLRREHAASGRRRRRAGARRPERPGRGPQLLLARPVGRVARQRPPRLLDRHRRASAVRDPVQGHRDRARCRQRRSPARRATSSGPATTGRSSTSRSIRRRCSRKRVKRHVVGTDPATDVARVRGEGRELLHGRRTDQGRPLPVHQREQHGLERDALHPGRPADGRRSRCSCRASATSSTTRSTPAGAG